MRCPTLPESIAATVALLPRGRAWQNHEATPQEFVDPPFMPVAFSAPGFQTEHKPGTILYRFWSAIGAVRWWLESRLCALREEFWCASKTETHNEWMAEYGLPDPCDPFPDLCAKVSAIGGTRCEYYQAVAARAGWAIECMDGTVQCGAQTGCDEAGDAQTGYSRKSGFFIVVYLGDSPSFYGGGETQPQTGLISAGEAMACDAPDITGLRCLIERMVHAHLEVNYILVS
ncbi:MAG TPA: hypothetical protein VNQ99_17580 [Xanthobacteraceae bacterium]|nr:hypothetical protein [Xanthobacteraceae bacterium]